MNRKSFDAEHHAAYRQAQHEGWKVTDRARIAKEVARRRMQLAFVEATPEELAEIERIEAALLESKRKR